MDKLRDLPYFNLVSVMQLLSINEHNGRVWLSRQSKAGRIVRLVKGKYILKEVLLVEQANPDFVGMVANIVQPHSYLSGAWVLQKYGVMSEGIFNITSVTSKHTREIVNDVGRFVYYHMDDKYFEGYSEKDVRGVVVREASLAKALYDYLYLRKMPERIDEKEFSIIEDLRLNLGHVEQAMKDEFESWVKRYQSPKMQKILRNMRRSEWA